MSDRSVARQLASEALDRGQPLEWFEELYSQAMGDPSVIPWADLCVNPNLERWVRERSLQGDGRSALVIGCGLGDDAAFLAELGFRTVGIELSESAVAWCQRRFGDAGVEFRMLDLFALAGDADHQFDFVLEIYTLQVLPPDLRRTAMQRIASSVAPGGTLLVITRGRGEDDPTGAMPWPLLRTELAEFTQHGLVEAAFADYLDEEDPPVRRFCAAYRRADG